MPKLNDTQLIILSAAAKRQSGTVLPLPKSAGIDEAKTETLLKGLQKRGLIEPQTLTGKPRSGADGTSRAQFVISAAGRAAIGIEETEARSADKEVASAVDAEAPGIRANSKLRQVEALLRRAEGASIEEIMSATGWQAHSVRGAISGSLKKKHGLTVASARAEDGIRRYRIEAAG